MTPPKKVLHISDLAGLGGLQSAVRNLAESQQRMGYEVQIMAPPWDPPSGPGGYHTRIPVHPWTPALVSQFPLIHTHAGSGFLNKRWRRLSSSPTVVHTYQGSICGIFVAMRWFLNFVGRNGWTPYKKMLTEARGGWWAHRVIAVSPKVLTETALYYRVRQRKITVIPNGYIPYSGPLPAKAALRSKFGLPQDRFLILFVGRPDPVKDFTSVLEAFRKLLAGNKNAALVVAPRQDIQGEGVYSLEVPPKEVADLYLACDVFVNASKYDAYSLAVHEALAYGLPVIHSDRCGNAGFTTNGLDALIVARRGKPPVSQQLHTAMSTLMMDDTLRSRLAHHAKTKFAPMTWDWVARQTEAVYLTAQAAR